MIPSCYTVHDFSSSASTDEIKHRKIYKVETKEGVEIVANEKVTIENTENGVAISDSIGIRNYKFENLKTISIKEISPLNTVLLISGLAVGAAIVFVIYSFSTLKLQ